MPRTRDRADALDVLGQTPQSRLDSAPYWPRRLLHMPTMCSHKRKRHDAFGPGFFGSRTRRPPYATLSYTWGRYITTSTGASSDSTNLVKNIPWKIPSVNPEHFVAEDLSQVIQTIHKITGLEYLWIDIACIKTEWAPDTQLGREVSMQQDIFRNSAASFVWLSETSASCLTAISTATTESLPQEDIFNADHTRMVNQLRRIIEDPWFTSLWTLPEGAVQPGAILLSQHGYPAVVGIDSSALRHRKESVSVQIDFGDRNTIAMKKVEPRDLARPHTESSSMAQFLSLRDLARLLRTVSLKLPAHSFGDFRETAKLSGLLSLEPFNVLSLYFSAQHRHRGNSDPRFRLRFINKQIFRFPSAPNEAEVLEMEDHFASQLLRRNFVASQLFTRRTEVKKDRMWYLTPDCEIPALDLFTTCFNTFKVLYSVMRESFSDIDHMGELAFRCLDQNGKSHGLRAIFTTCFGALKGLFKIRPELDRSPPNFEFEGPSRPLRDLACLWLDQPETTQYRLLGLSLDECRLPRADGSVRYLPCMVSFPVQATGGFTVSKTEQNEHISEFLNLTCDTESRMLAIALGRGSEPRIGLVVGLILLRRQSKTSEDSWQRSGICFWSFKLDVGDEFESDCRGTSIMNLPGGDWENLRVRAGYC